MEPTNEQIRKVLAEFMGWEEIELCTNCGQLHGERPGGSLIDDVPDYTNDLNAMHDVLLKVAEDDDLWKALVAHVLPIVTAFPDQSCAWSDSTIARTLLLDAKTLAGAVYMILEARNG